MPGFSGDIVELAPHVIAVADWMEHHAPELPPDVAKGILSLALYVTRAALTEAGVLSEELSSLAARQGLS